MTIEHDPVLLRKLAAEYRQRAETETSRSRILLQIADELEADARRRENP